MSAWDATNEEEALVAAMGGVIGFKAARDMVGRLKAKAWREGYEDGVYSVGINSEVMCPYA